MQVENLDAIVVPVSGGGMISGVATAAKALRPDITIVAAEPTGQASPAVSAELPSRIPQSELPPHVLQSSIVDAARSPKAQQTG